MLHLDPEVDEAVIHAGATRLAVWADIETQRAARDEAERLQRRAEWERRRSLPPPPPDPETWGSLKVERCDEFIDITAADNEWDAASVRITREEAKALAARVLELAT